MHEPNLDPHGGRPGPGPMNGAPPEPAPLDVRELIATFWRRRWLILAVVTVVLGGFGWRWWARVPEYRAQGRIQVVEPEPSVPGLAVGAPSVSLPADPVNSEVEILKSRTLLEAVVDSLGLRLTLGASPLRRSALFPDLRVAPDAPSGEYALVFRDGVVEVVDLLESVLWRGTPGEEVRVAGISFTAPDRPEGYPAAVRFFVTSRRGAGSVLRGRLRVSAVQRTNLVDLSYRDYDPELAAAVLNAVMELGRRQSIERLRQQAARRREFIQEKVAEYELKLRAAEAEVQAYQERIGAVSPESEEAGQVSNILTFERQIEELRLERQLYAPILRNLEAEEAGPDAGRGDLKALSAAPALVKNPAIGDLYRRIVALGLKRDSLVSGPAGAGPGNWAVQAVDDQIAATRAELVDAIREYVRGLDRQIGALETTVARLREETKGLLPHAAELARLEQRVESLRRVYETLQAQLEQTRIEEAAESGKLAIIDWAVVPTRPVNALQLGDVILALVLAGILGFGGALVVEYFDDRVRSPTELRRRMGLTVLGVVPRFDPLDGRGEHSREWARVHLEPRSAPAEAYRVIRTNLAFSGAVKPRRTILVTSPGPGEGKTTTATNLAVALARQGDRTLLVDADLRKASLHRLLDVSREPGLTDCLTGAATEEEAIVRADVDGLDVLPSGPLPPNAAELLGSERMAALLARLAERYDQIVLDSPPVLAVADPSVLAQRLDGVLMVVRAGQTGRQALLEAMQRLADIGGDVLGVVVNALRREPGYGAGYYYYYYRDGYYGDERRSGLRRRIRRLLGAGRA